MAVKLRLTRMGAKKRPMYRIVASDSHRSRDGQYLELIGTYNPTTDPATVRIDKEIAMKWLTNGAIPSDTVRSLFQKEGIMKAFAEQRDKNSKKKSKKAVKEVEEKKVVKKTTKKESK